MFSKSPDILRKGTGLTRMMDAHRAREQETGNLPDPIEKAARRRARFEENFERTRLRRKTIVLHDNPRPHVDYVVTWRSHMSMPGLDFSIDLSLRYVPDHYILHREALGEWLACLRDEHWESMEDLATTMLEDLRNELVARWINLELRMRNEDTSGGIEDHSVMLEDKFPRWDNTGLLQRLRLNSDG